MVRIVVIGIGAMGKKYALMLHKGMIPSIQLVGVCCRSKENQSWATQNLPNVTIYPSTEQLFMNADNFDAVLIVTPHKDHPSIACEAFAHKKHVFCDKPAGITAADAQRINEAAREAKTTYAMMFHNRTFPIFQKCKELVTDGTLGQLLRITLVSTKSYRTAWYHHSGSWRSSFTMEGGGALINQGQHILDLWQWLFGMPESVYATIPFGKYNDFLVDDEVTMFMQYPNRLTATFIMSTGEAFGQDRIEVVGTKGKFVVEGNQLTIYRSSLDSREYGATATVNSLEEYPMTTETITYDMIENPYVMMLTNFVEAIEQHKPLIAPGIEGENALMLTNAAYLSADLKQLVRLPIESAEYEEFLSKKRYEETKK